MVVCFLRYLEGVQEAEKLQNIYILLYILYNINSMVYYTYY